MATLKQEQLYNEIVKYYSYADDLVSETEESSHDLANQQFNVVETMVTSIEKCADQLTTQYLDFVKNGQSDKISESVRSSFNEILTKVEECRNKLSKLQNEGTAEIDNTNE